MTAPPALTPEEAATEFESIVEPYNTALEALAQAINAGQPIEALRTQADALAAVNATQIAALRAARWPPEVQPSVDALTTESEAAQTFFPQAARAESRQGVIDAVVAASQHDGADAAAEIRRLFGRRLRSFTNYRLRIPLTTGRCSWPLPRHSPR